MRYKVKGTQGKRSKGKRLGTKGCKAKEASTAAPSELREGYPSAS